MGIFDGVIIATDIDGTFLGKSSRLVPENLKAIEYFKANGGKFTFATGRVFRNILLAIPYACELSNAPIICCNGAYMYDSSTDKLINTHPASPDNIMRAVRYVRDRHPEVGARVCTSYGYISDGRTELIKHDLSRFTNEERRILPVEDWFINPGEEWYKIVFRGNPDDLIAARADTEAQFGDIFEYANSSTVFFEVNQKGCTKAAAVSELREMFRTPSGKLPEAYCCGDYENDLPMLKAADHSVCPSNARPDVVASCELVLCNNDDGIFKNLMPIIEGRMRQR